MTSDPRTIAYFSMEIAIDPAMPTYAGGLGVLAGDTIRAAADLGVPMVAVTLLHRKGYFRQKLLPDGSQRANPWDWRIEDLLVELRPRVLVTLEGRSVQIRAWRYVVKGAGEFFQVPVYFLDADVPENAPDDRRLTDFLYGGDERYRLCQEVILGIGGVRMLRALGHDVARFHMNEGHSSLLGLELLEEAAAEARRKTITWDEIDAVREKCVFTTHTPVQAALDQFDLDLVEQVLGHHEAFEQRDVFCCDGRLNMTLLALNLSHYVNGVARRHGEVTRLLYAGYRIDAITNGIHVPTWVAPPLAAVYDRHLSGWREDSFSLRYAIALPPEELWRAHVAAKESLVAELARRGETGFDPAVFTIGFARRATPYKRADLVFCDLARLKSIAASAGPFQLVFGGKAHPRDEAGIDVIRRVFAAREQLRGALRIAWLEDYDLSVARTLIAGSDLWLNTPEPPLEASGTSGMKAAVNGVPSLSVLDGWWIEGHVEGVTGWSIGEDRANPSPHEDSAAHASSLYGKLESAILPMFYREPERYRRVMIGAIALNGAFFNSHRMLQQYVRRAYSP